MARTTQQWHKLLYPNSKSDTAREAERRAASDENIPPWLLLAYIKAKPPEAASALSNPSAPDEALRYAVENYDFYGWEQGWRNLQAIAENPMAGTAILKEVQKRGVENDHEITPTIASNPSCSVEFLDELALSGDPSTVRNVHKNPSFPPDRLPALAHQSEGAASNPHCPPEVVQAVLMNENVPEDIRRGAARNPSCPPNALMMHIEQQTRLGRDPYWEQIIRNPTTPSRGVQAYIDNHKLPYEILPAAGHPNCSSETLTDILRNGEYGMADEVWLRAINHPNCTADLLEEVTSPDNSEFYGYTIQSLAFWHPNLSKSDRKRLSKDGFLCSRMESARRRFKSSFGQKRIRDSRRRKVYNGEAQWRFGLTEREAIYNRERAQEIAINILAHPELRARYPHIEKWDNGGINIEMGVDHPTASGTYTPTHTRISDSNIWDNMWERIDAKDELVEAVVRLAPGCSDETLTHELAHAIVDQDPRFRIEPYPAAHGEAFTAVMLDLVESRHGPEQRERLRASYKQHGAPLDKRDSPLTPSDPLSGIQTAGGITPTSAWVGSSFCGYPIKGGTGACRNKILDGSRKCAAGHPSHR